MRACLSIVLITGFAVAGEKPGDEAKKERERFQGVWKVVSTELDGNTNNKPAEGDKAVVKGDKIVLTSDGKDVELYLISRGRVGQAAAHAAAPKCCGRVRFQLSSGRGARVTQAAEPFYAGL